MVTNSQRPKGCGCICLNVLHWFLVPMVLVGSQPSRVLRSWKMMQQVPGCSGMRRQASQIHASEC